MSRPAAAAGPPDADRFTNRLANYSLICEYVKVSPKPIRLRHRNLPLLLLQARERVISQFRPILNANGITEQQWRVVRALLDVPALEPREIGELCRISSPSLAGVLARMQELGFVVRERLQHDQRRVRVSLTARARALAARMAPQIEATYRRIETSLGGEFNARFERMLDQLLATLQPRSPARRSHGGRRLPEPGLAPRGP
jgi:homoprotocatechuate degradation regulator HpaR